MNLIKIVILFFIIFISTNQNDCKAQFAWGIDYSMPFFQSKNKGDLKSSSLFGFNVGVRGSGWKPYGGINLNYLRIVDNSAHSVDTTLKYRKFMWGLEIGVRPFSSENFSRFQPLLEIGTKMSFGFLTNKTTSKIAFVYVGAGFEFFITDGFSITSLYSYDIVFIDKYRTKGATLNIGLKKYIL